MAYAKCFNRNYVKLSWSGRRGYGAAAAELSDGMRKIERIVLRIDVRVVFHKMTKVLKRESRELHVPFP